IQAVQFACSLRFPFEIDKLRHLRLHAKRQLVVGDGRFQLAYRAKPVEHAMVQLAEQIQLALLHVGSRFARRQVRDGMLALTEQRSLIGRREKTAAEQIEAAGRDQAALENDES